MKNLKGFTLIELLVVVAVVGVMMGALIAILNPVQFFKQGRDGRRISDLSMIQAALEQYYAQNGNYPADVPDGGMRWEYGGVTYLKSVPGDPSGGNYKYCLNTSNYEICANMEDDSSLPSDCSAGTFATGDNCQEAVDCCLVNPF